MCAKKAKFWSAKKRKFEHSDYFLDYLKMYIHNDRYNYAESFLHWSFAKTPEKKDPHEKPAYYYNTEG
jgi:hypothetical protein